MIKIYSDKGNPVNENIKRWLSQKNLPFEEINLSIKSLERIEILTILCSKNKSIDDIVYEKRETYKKLNLDLSQTFYLSSLISAIEKEQKLLKFPFLVDTFYLQIFFNEEEVEYFLKSNKLEFDEIEI